MAFHPAYLSGFYADAKDVVPSIYEGDAKILANEITVDELKKHATFKDFDITISKSKNYSPYETMVEECNYALFPVWFMSYRKNDRVAYVAINGQTGKVSTDIPIDYKKYVLGSLLLSLPLFFLFQFLLSITAQTAMIITTLLAMFCSFVFLYEVSEVLDKDSGKQDRGRLHYDGKKRRAKTTSLSVELKNRFANQRNLLGFLFTGVSTLFSLLVFFFHPVYDIFYYGASLLAIFAILFLVYDIMQDYNTLATRKLPQFNRKGGDDRARS